MRSQEGGLRQAENFWLHLTTPVRSICVSLSAFFIGDFSAQISCITDDWEEHMSAEGTAQLMDNGEIVERLD